MSSAHLVFGRPTLRFAQSVVLVSGSQRAARAIHSSASLVATLEAHFHFRLLCIVTQSSSLSCFIRRSASRVHLFIHSAHGSNVVSSVREVSGRGGGSVECVLSTSSSVVESVSVTGSWLGGVIGLVSVVTASACGCELADVSAGDVAE